MGAPGVLGTLAIMMSLAQQPSTVFLGGSFIVVRTTLDQTNSEQGYLATGFTGAPQWPVGGVIIDGGVFVAAHWSLGGDVAWRQPATGAMTENTQTGHTDFTVVSSTYTTRERLMSFTVRRHGHPRIPIDLQPLAGFTISSSTRTLTNRTGTHKYVGYPPSPYTPPDAVANATEWGVLGGADVTIHVGNGVSLTGGPRIYWIKRPSNDPYIRTTPGDGPVVIHFGGGIQWRR